MKMRFEVLAGGFVAFAVILLANTHMVSAQSRVSSPDGTSASSKDRDLGSSDGGWSRNFASPLSSKSPAARRHVVVFVVTDGTPSQGPSANGDVLDLTIDQHPSERKRREAQVLFSTFD
ncbi:MAG: hypothetical protein IPK59_07000 [Rhodospirillaceae bacterium]|nr:hypothetical protein [Rhodospirillaceae bacterium]